MAGILTCMRTTHPGLGRDAVFTFCVAGQFLLGRAMSSRRSKATASGRVSAEPSTSDGPARASLRRACRYRSSPRAATRKRAEPGPLTTENRDAPTAAGIAVLGSDFDRAERQLTLELRLTNSGETTWLYRQRASGWVTIALRSEPLGAEDFCEALPRHRLTANVAPGETLQRELSFYLPTRCTEASWFVDLVNEGYFWFSQRGTVAAEVTAR